MKLFTSIKVFFLDNFLSRSLVIILLGPPGAGKGTHAVKLSKKLNLPHISTGDLFRENLSNDTSLGQKAKTYMDQGMLVPDEIVLDMLFARIEQKDCKKGYLLDGFPRTLDQAEALDKRLDDKIKLMEINLAIEDKFLIERITGRLMCKKCGTPFHKKFAPPKVDQRCDHCQENLYQRKDDTEEVAKERLSTYHTQTEPLIVFYKNKKDKNIYCEVDANQSQEKVFEAILKLI